jgi:transcriptional regulator NrdR family protein
MYCPKCGHHKTSVNNVIVKDDFTKRYRRCNKCGFKFKTSERSESDWDYKNIVLKIKDMLREVK